ncbi:MAG: inner-membrane translocator [Chloroflexi bacterium OLB13]|nr:MAG: inner-membrane translocator [Chloroflexi bacterium OLB13]
MSALISRWRSIPRWAQLVILAAVVIFVPPVINIVERQTGFGLLTQVNRALIYVSLALGLNIVVGFAGLLDLGYAAFFAIGAYTFGILTWPSLRLDFSFFIAIWVCVLVAALFGMLIGAPTLRLRGDYLAIVTLAFGEIIPPLVRNLDNITIRIGDLVLVESFNLTNGPLGMKPLGRPNFGIVESIAGLSPGQLDPGVNPTFWYFIIVILVLVVLSASRRFEDSRIGRAWRAIREDETAARFMGVNTVRVKLLAFAFGASFSGLAGAVFASMLGAIFPELFRFQVSVFLLIIVILSGAGSVWGVLIGGLLISTFDGVLLAQIMPSIFPNSDVQSLRWVFFGIGLIAVMLFRPQGLFGHLGQRQRASQPVKEAAHGDAA